MPHRFTHQCPPPFLRLARVAAVPLDECRLELVVAVEVLARETDEVLGRWSEVGTPEVDDPDDAVVDQPVAWLPVAVCRHDAGTTGSSRAM